MSNREIATIAIKILELIFSSKNCFYLKEVFRGAFLGEASISSCSKISLRNILEEGVQGDLVDYWTLESYGYISVSTK